MTDPEPSTDPTPLQLATTEELFRELAGRFETAAFVATHFPQQTSETIWFRYRGSAITLHGLMDTARHITLGNVLPPVDEDDEED